MGLAISPAVVLLLQTSPTPLWVPLLIIGLILLMLWWGLTRGRVYDENLPRPEDAAHAGHAEPVLVESALEVEPAAVLTAEAAPTAADSDGKPVAEAALDSAVGEAFAQQLANNDLTLIEGVGPKTASVLTHYGYDTFTAVAQADTHHLRILLHENRLDLADPSSWPQQAQLVVAQDWHGLAALQEQLKGGSFA